LVPEENGSGTHRGKGKDTELKGIGKRGGSTPFTEKKTQCDGYSGKAGVWATISKPMCKQGAAL